MYITSSMVVAALASCAVAQAQTPKGFTPSVNTKLELFFNSTSVKTAGELLSKASMTISQHSSILSTDTRSHFYRAETSNRRLRCKSERHLHVRHA